MKVATKQSWVTQLVHLWNPKTEMSCHISGGWQNWTMLSKSKKDIYRRWSMVHISCLELRFLIQFRILPYFPHSSVCLFVSQPWYLNFHRWFDGLDPENHRFYKRISSRLTTWTTWTIWTIWTTYIRWTTWTTCTTWITSITWTTKTTWTALSTWTFGQSWPPWPTGTPGPSGLPCPTEQVWPLWTLWSWSPFWNDWSQVFNNVNLQNRQKNLLLHFAKRLPGT